MPTIARERLESNRSAEEPAGQTNVEKRVDRRIATFHLVNKNLAYYPLACDLRNKRWRWARDSEHWIGRLPGDDQIVYRFPANVNRSLLRPPTAFEVNVLFLILATAQLRNTESIDFSRAEVLRLLELGADTANRRRVRQAFEYWSHVTIIFNKWYQPGSRCVEGRSVTKRLRPPLTRQAALEVDRDWRDLSLHKYRVKLYPSRLGEAE
jgi:hypothetical protein